MSTYHYEAVSRSGVNVKGVVQAPTRDDAVVRLKDEMSVVLDLKEVRDFAGLREKITKPRGKITSKSISLVCEQFSIILKAGVPLGRAVRLVEHQTRDKVFKEILKDVADDVDAGYSVADSMELHGDKLPATLIETVRAGEESGSLEQSFARLKDFYMARYKLYSKIRGAMIYPTFVIALAFVVVAIVMIYAIPVMAQVFVEQGGELPAITRVLIGMSNFFRHWTWLLVIVILLVFLAFRAYGRTEDGGIRLSKLLLKLPLFGKIETLSIASQFSATMATMLTAGIPLVRALTITGETLTNRYVSRSMRTVENGVESGFSLGDCMRKEHSVDDLLIEMCSMGEESGTLDETLGSISKYYDYETEAAATAALAKLEPTILVFLGLFVGFIVIALYMPMFTMYNGM